MTGRKIVVGAGPGGLAAAMLLASQGYEVDVYEKQAYVGGRNGSFTLDGYTFDIGPTFFSMPQILEELFEAAARNLHDYVDLIELTPMYELKFRDVTVKMARDRDMMRQQIATYFPGNEEGYDRFMKDVGDKMKALTPILQSKMDRYRDYLKLDVLKALPQLSLGRSLYDVLSDYFTDERLKIAFTFQSKYLGMSPWECPGAFAILSYMEHAWGVFHPRGGVNQLSQAMARVIGEYGGRIHLNRGVRQLLVDGDRVIGVELEDGTTQRAEDVVVNADFGTAMTKLVPPQTLRKFTPEKLAKKKYSCSTFMLYLGVNKTFASEHHTIVFAEDYKRNVEQITKTMTMPDDPSIYVQNAVVTDASVAPAGKSALYILAPVPNNFSGLDWEQYGVQFRELVLDALEQHSDFKGLRDAIEVERIITPKQWEEEIYVYGGATFNLGHQLTQMMVLRPHNEFDELRHMYLVGGGTHPGSGLPTIFESARISTNLILRKDGKQQVAISTTKRLEEAL